MMTVKEKKNKEHKTVKPMKREGQPAGGASAISKGIMKCEGVPNQSTVIGKGKKKKHKQKFAKDLKQKVGNMNKNDLGLPHKGESLQTKPVAEKHPDRTGNQVKNDRKVLDKKSFKGKRIVKAENTPTVVQEKKMKSENNHTGASEKNVNAQNKQGVVSEKKRMKRLMWKQKQMAKKLERKGLVNKHEKQLNKMLSQAKVELPKTAQEATANWQKLQETISTGSKSTKRKLHPDKIRNPKYRKVGDWQDKNDTVDQEEGKEAPEIWFDDVDNMLLDRKPVSMTTNDDENTDDKDAAMGDNPLVKPGAFKGVTKTVCMDCEMVGVGDGSDNMLARVSIVNQYGEPIYDKFVKPKEEVVDYRTYVSGVRPQDLVNAEDFEQVQKDVSEILKGKTLVGHAIKNDLKVLYLSHPRKRIRDTSLYKPFRQLSGGRTPSLKKLSEKILAVKVQEGEHNSVQDAQATMRLYTMYRKQWESELSKRKNKQKGKKEKT